ncbi:calcium/sodium antiporter [[Clostridium] hylemonae]|uniref:K+-dependent Na+/Ca+ exchanger family protein n=1 Tax=[Clostridium] hylemonae DSM 15053 TaxID=553973 RepID=C0C582_9FIRM|nr:calcium/sodium antiporter [[Clostridium] hylemonae]EEG72619.1 K+-dependent Na+/Ca+ exchanger family protein [[Clostridium] hylemonae DSM 15053]QEK16498.1 Inner membrane protein YrbG [[Clostridium] hylemonae DSM 15053]BDF03073.1 K+-dependent Na+/Ca+ exchanger [[Clostridium] hylemonae]
MEYVKLILGFLLLIKGADLFVDGSSSVAKILKVPAIIIGLTVVAFGTSMPELSVSATAALKGNNDLAVSNVLGSNLFNLLVVLGCCALVQPVRAKWSLLRKEFPFSIFITLILLLLNSDFSITKVLKGDQIFVLGRYSGLLLLTLFVVFLFATVRSALRSRNEMPVDEEDYKVMSPLKSGVFIAVGLAGIIWGGDLVVDSASSIAKDFGLSQTFIGLTIVALGTSLPELVTSMVAAGKGENDLAVGNVVGSNIFNILLILGVSSVITPIKLDVTAVYDTLILVAASIIVYVAAISKHEIKKTEGVMFLLAYLAFFVYILLR